jgi:autophagy-related protein 11
MGDLFLAPGQQGSSERNDSFSSVKSPRISEDYKRSSDGEHGFLQRIQQLEGDLAAERERSLAFEKDLKSRTTQHNDIIPPRRTCSRTSRP